MAHTVGGRGVVACTLLDELGDCLSVMVTSAQLTISIVVLVILFLVVVINHGFDIEEAVASSLLGALLRSPVCVVSYGRRLGKLTSFVIIFIFLILLVIIVVMATALSILVFLVLVFLIRVRTMAAVVRLLLLLLLVLL